jgi:hypothetical protein
MHQVIGKIKEQPEAQDRRQYLRYGLMLSLFRNPHISMESQRSRGVNEKDTGFNEIAPPRRHIPENLQLTGAGKTLHSSAIREGTRE